MVGVDASEEGCSFGWGGHSIHPPAADIRADRPVHIAGVAGPMGQAEWDSRLGQAVAEVRLGSLDEERADGDAAVGYRSSPATEQLAAQASYISYGPARKSSAPLVGKYHNKAIDMGPQMPTNPANLANAAQSDFEFWADNADQLNERFNAWLAN